MNYGLPLLVDFQFPPMLHPFVVVIIVRHVMRASLFGVFSFASQQSRPEMSRFVVLLFRFDVIMLLKFRLVCLWLVAAGD